MNATTTTKKNPTTTCTFSANPKLTKASAGIVIKQLSEFKRQYPSVTYIRYEDGLWTYTDSEHNREITNLIQQAELAAIEKVNQVFRSELNEHRLGKPFTGLMIKKLRELRLPEGARPPRFDNESRIWSFQATTQASLDQLKTNFEEFEARCLDIFAPPVVYQIGVKQLPRQGPRFSNIVNANLKAIQLPENARPIFFDRSSLEWKFACQTSDDMDLLLDRFDRYIGQVIYDLDHPEEVEKRREEARKIHQVIPSPVDFPSLPTTTTNSIA